MIRSVRCLPILLLALATAGPGAAQTETAPAAAAQTFPAITVITVRDADIRDRVYASGLIQPVEEVMVQPQIEGQAIDSLQADVGSVVKEGDVMARLSQTSLKLMRSQLVAARAAAVAALAQGKAQLAEATINAQEALRVQERAQTLQKSGSVSQSQADLALADSAAKQSRVAAASQGVTAAEAQIAVADAKSADVDLSLARATVTAPVGGLVVARNASVGAIATATGSPMFVLVKGGLLELRADVAERDILRLAPGQSVDMRVVGLAETVKGHVRLVEPTVDTTTRLGRVRIQLDDPGMVRSGMYAEAAILVASHHAPVVPGAAIEVADGTATILVVGPDDTLKRVPVVTGIRENGRVEVLSGASAGDTIVSRAGAFVREGDRIHPVPDAAARVGE